MLNVLNDRVIIDSHEPSVEQCETMTLLANALDASKDFKTVAYRSGYAEFERVGNAGELRFVANLYTANIVFDDGVDRVIWSNNPNLIAGNYITLSPGQITDTISTIAYNIILKDGFSIDNITETHDSVDVNFTFTRIDDTTFSCVTDGFDYTITVTTKYVGGGGGSMTKSVDLTTLSGWTNLPDGEHTITVVAKGTGYANSEKSAGVTVTKGSAGETWVLNETLTTAITSTLPTTVINFTSNGTNFKAIGTISGAGPYAGNPIMYSETTTVSEESTRAWSGSLGVWVDTAYRTLTFQTPPTGDLLTWLQANGTKQGGGVTEYTLTLASNLDITVKVNGNSITSPYTLQNGDVITLQSDMQGAKITIGDTTYNTDTGVDVPSTVYSQNIYIANGAKPSPSLISGLTITFSTNPPNSNYHHS